MVSRAVTSKAEPKRHHFIPQWLLRNFTDDADHLHFWRRGFAYGDVRKSSPKNLFVEKDLYAYTDKAGKKNVDLEKFYASFDSSGAAFIDQITAIVRVGAIPTPDRGAWEFWYRFLYYQMKRVPGYMDAIAERMDLRGKLSTILDKRRHELPDTVSVSEAVADIANRARVYAQGRGPTEDVISAARNMGIAIYHTVDPRKSFILGDVPGATVSLAGDPKEILFVPIAFDTAIGFLAAARQVQVVRIDADNVRRMNLATADRSTLFAGRSPQLIESVARASTYRGVVEPDERKKAT